MNNKMKVLKEILELMKEKGWTFLKLEYPRLLKIEIKRSVSQLPQEQKIQQEQKTQKKLQITSPTVGVFYPIVKQHQIVQRKEIIGKIKILGIEYLIESPADGKILFLKEGPVEFGETIAEIEVSE
jgi:biotin carboxyl carrier protein